MIIQNQNCFVLNTRNTTYAFRVNGKCGCLEHMYYGRRIHMDNDDGLVEQHAFAPGNTVCYEKGMENYSLEDVCLEFSSYGKGDIREPMVEVVNFDGSNSLDFKYADAKISAGKTMLKTLPSSYANENALQGAKAGAEGNAVGGKADIDESGVSELRITMRDEGNKLSLILKYAVFEECDVIVRSAELINEGDEPIRLKRMLSSLIDFDRAGLVFTTFNGAWTREMKKTDTMVAAGKFVNDCYTGTSSNRSNPFVMLSDGRTTDSHGECYGFNLIYSGNHYEALEVNSHGKTRLVQGINPNNFDFVIGKDESFEAPEAVVTFSDKGFNELSGHMHDFIRNHIVRGEYKNKVRPILLNSWEASYFNIDQNSLLKLAKTGKDVGIELFVVDDGWFSKRDDDTSSLGDWDVNRKKLPGGLAGLCEKITELGLLFGIWVEPEMICVNSDLYKEHPEWAVDIPGKNHSEGRNQRLLDLTREDVQNFIIEKMTEVFSSADISYVKWDMNRIFSDVYSKSLAKDRQGEVLHRYVMGLYHVMSELTERFPHILFEGCASGGNRFDLGILCSFPQIWASDNTDALCRAEIQNNYSYGYPMSVLSAHVSGAPNHQTLRTTPLESRFHVASFGLLGYECNLSDMKREDLKAIEKEIALYKEWREILQFGRFYRGRSFANADVSTGSVLANADNFMEWTCVSADKKKAVGMLMQKLATPNTQYFTYKPCGLIPDAKYRITSRDLKHNLKEFGDLVNMVSPIHLKQDSFAHNMAAKFVKMDSAIENHTMYGDALMYAGLKMKPAFSGTGYDENVRYFQDFSSEMFFMESIRE